MDLDLVYGKNNLERIVCIEVRDNEAELFLEMQDGEVSKKTIPFKHYALYEEQLSPKFKPLSGEQPYKYLYEGESKRQLEDVVYQSRKKGYDVFIVRDVKESLMCRHGYTYFKGMKVSDVSVLSFDIETSGLTFDKGSTIFLISNTFRKNGKIEKRLFSIDEFKSQREMIDSWCAWVRQVNPSIVTGHNIFTYDLPYLEYVAQKNNTKLLLGRDGSRIHFAFRKSQFRKDGSQSYEYTNALIYGREIVDTYFLALKYDIGRNYENYGLKTIIKHENLQKENRTFFDAGKIAASWNDLELRNKIKEYAIDDADDSLALFDLMVPSFFYYTQSIPRSFQQVINSATGSQINSLMIRAYLQRDGSVAKGSEKIKYPGAISFGIPGNHKNVLRFDVASLYPSIIRQYKIYCKEKDPEALFLKLVESFTLERLKNKKISKETGERYYHDLQESQKIAINSMYGFMGAPRLNYNYFPGADQVTAHGRRILKQAILFLTGKEYEAEADDEQSDEENG